MEAAPVTDQATVTDQTRKAPEKLRLTQYLGYGAGDAANNVTFMMTSMFLLLYYTDVVGIPAATVGTLFLLVRIWDGLADIFAGRVVDATSTRWGKFRPFLLFGSLPLLLLNVAVFTVPDLGIGGTLVYAYASYALFGLAYSMVNIPYGSLAGAMTQDSEERSRLASFRVIGSNLAILTLAVVVAPQIEGSDNLQRSLTITTLTLVVVGFALYLFTFFTSKERVERGVATVTLRETVTTVRQNKALVVLCLSSLAFLVGMFSLQTVAIYYARDVLGDSSYYIVLTVVQTAGTFAGALLLPRVVGVIGKKYTYISAGAIAIVGGIGVALRHASLYL
jgi:glucuronide carrier protein